MRVGWIDLNKEEERLFTQAVFFGIFFGFTFGTIVFLFIIFPMMSREHPRSFLEWARIIFIPMIILTGSGWLSSTAFAYVKYNKERENSSLESVGKIANALVISFPVALLYMALVICIVILPFDLFFFQWLGFATFSLGMLVAFPFVFFFIAIGLPDSKPRKILNRLYRRLKRKNIWR